MHKNAERITALIANPKTVWSEHDRAYLESVTDERLATLEAHAKPETKQEPAPAAAAATPTAELKLEQLPAAWQSAIRAAEKAEKEQRAGLITKLAAAQSGFSKEDLDEMSFEQLQKLGKAVLKNAGTEVIDFAAAAGARSSASGEDDEYADDAPDLISAVRTARGIK